MGVLGEGAVRGSEGPLATGCFLGLPLRGVGPTPTQVSAAMSATAGV